MSTLIHERVQLARQGENPFVISQVKSGWVVIGDVQPLEGYCLLLSDPVVPSINDLNEEQRIQFSKDMYAVGDLLLKATDAYRINYEILGNSEPALHAHIIPRYESEVENKRKGPAMCHYSWPEARKFDAKIDAELIHFIKSGLR